MDLNSEFCDVSPKVEPDSENSDADNDIWSKRDPRLYWTSEKTLKLINIMENDCKELWDIKNPFNKDRNARQLKLEHLASKFGTTSDEISRKIHNLRTQFNNELRKIKKRQGSSSNSSWGESSANCSSNGGGSSWEYFDALSFLQRNPSGGDPLDVNKEGVNLALAEFQDTEEEFEGQAGASNSTRKPKVATSSAPPPLPIRDHPMMWLNDSEPRLAPLCTRVSYGDDCKIFGDFVASELRSLHSKEFRKKLKRIIQKAILQISHEEELTMRK